MLKCGSAVWPVVLVGAAMMGCGQPDVDSGPSYSDLVVTYNAELAALDRLETKRDQLIAKYAAESAGDESVDTLSQFEGLLESAKAAKKDADLELAADPNAQLDDLIERSGEAQELAGELLDGLLGGEVDAASPEPTPEEIAAIAERKAAFDAELAELNLEIAKQEERVERARQARDKAEAKSDSSK